MKLITFNWQGANNCDFSYKYSQLTEAEIQTISGADFLCFQEFPDSMQAAFVRQFPEFGPVIFDGLETAMFYKRELFEPLLNPTKVSFEDITSRKTSRHSAILQKFKIRQSSKCILVGTIHLHANVLRKDSKSRFLELKRILELVKDNKNILIAGDFNILNAQDLLLEPFLKLLGFENAIKSLGDTCNPLQTERMMGKIVGGLLKLFRYPFALDKIFYKNLEVFAVKKFKTRVSDHYMCVADFNGF